MTTQSAKSVPETPNVLSGEDTSIRPMTLVPSSSPEGIEERAAAIDSESGTQVAPAVAGPAPSVYFSGMPPRNGTNITDVVGGSVGDIVVQAPTGSGLQVTSVDLVISGGESKQDYTWYAGITTPAPATTTFAGNSTNLYTTGLWWDEKTGNHTITVTAHYNNNTTGTATLTANIVKPTVNSFTLRYQPLQFSDPGYTRPGYSNPWIGFHQGVDGGKTGDNAITPGDQFFASVSTTGMPVGGTFAILQKINADWSFTTNAGAKYTRNSNGDVLDPRPDTNLIFTNPFLFGFKSTR